MVRLKVPAAARVPLNKPLGLKVVPGGRFPPTWKLYENVMPEPAKALFKSASPAPKSSEIWPPSVHVKLMLTEVEFELVPVTSQGRIVWAFSAAVDNSKTANARAILLAHIRNPP